MAQIKSEGSHIGLDEKQDVHIHFKEGDATPNSKEVAVLKKGASAMDIKTEKLQADGSQFTRWNDLAAERVGGQVIFATDEWFAPASWLLKQGRGEFYPGRFVDTGQYMEGWETRRHNKDHDWCIIRLGLPGIIKGFDIDTNHFTGNYAEWAMVEAVCRDDNPSKSDLMEEKGWECILRKHQLRPGTPGKGHNFFATKTNRRWTHLKFHIYPDGGVARLRVYGIPQPRWDMFDADETINLAGIEYGARIVNYSDCHYSHPENILMPDKGKDMGDGWETKRRRGPGYDWCVVALAEVGSVRRLMIDTAHFKGNFPDTCSVEGTFVYSDEELEHAVWTTLLSRTRLQAHKEHYFSVSSPQQINYIRINIFPDGGISRIRVFGKRLNAKKPDTLSKLCKTLGSVGELGLDELSNPNLVPVSLLTDEAFAPFGKVMNSAKDPCETDIAHQFDPSDAFPIVQMETKDGLYLPVIVRTVQCFQKSDALLHTMCQNGFALAVAPPTKNGEEPPPESFVTFVGAGRQVVYLKAGVWYSRHPLLSNGQLSTTRLVNKAGEGHVTVTLSRAVVALTAEMKDSLKK